MPENGIRAVNGSMHNGINVFYFCSKTMRRLCFLNHCESGSNKLIFFAKNYILPFPTKKKTFIGSLNLISLVVHKEKRSNNIWSIFGHLNHCVCRHTMFNNLPLHINNKHWQSIIVEAMLEHLL